MELEGDMILGTTIQYDALRNSGAFIIGDVKFSILPGALARMAAALLKAYFSGGRAGRKRMQISIRHFTQLRKQHGRRIPMKKRLAKKIEKMRRKKIHEALEMVLEINTTQVRSQGAYWTQAYGVLLVFGSCSRRRCYRVSKWMELYAARRGTLECSSPPRLRAGDMERLLKELANKKKELQDAGKM
ncbi:MAG: hypothetical protein ACLR8P_01775 [Clostridium fessum]